MDKEEFDIMEVRPENSGWYFVTFYQYKKEKPSHPDHFQDWLEFEDGKWSYGAYEGVCYVCFINRKED